MNCPWDACSLCRLTACEITLVALLVLPGTSDCIPCHARQWGTSRPSLSPRPSPTQTFPCTFMLPYIRTNLTLTMVCTCSVSLLGAFTVVSPPFHFFCPLLLFDMDHWIFHQLLWIPPFAHPALFMKPFFCLAWLFFFVVFFKAYLYKELVCGTFCRHTEDILSLI